MGYYNLVRKFVYSLCVDFISVELEKNVKFLSNKFPNFLSSLIFMTRCYPVVTIEFFV